MADEWIKVRHCLWTHPKVVTLSLRLRDAGVTLTFAVGALMRAWCVADQHADDDGNVPMGAEALDALVEIPGFAQALASVGWLVVGDGSLQFVNYQQHNGPTAKKRAQSTLRMQLSRMRDVSVTQERHESVTRRRRRNRRREENTPLLLPPQLDTERMRAAWARWEQHRRELRKPLKPTTVESQLRQLESWGEERALAAIEYSITQGWTGLFEPGTSRANGRKPSRTDEVKAVFEEWRASHDKP